MRTSLTIALALVLASALSAHAEVPKLAGLTKTYADAHGLPVRIVKNDLGTRQVERHFVPVLPTTHADFLATFSEANGAAVWKAPAADKIHGAMSFGPNDVVTWGNRHGDNSAALPHAANSPYVALALDKSQTTAWKGFIDMHTAGGVPYNFYNGDGASRFKTFLETKGQTMFGGCMWWVTHADVGEGKNLAHLMGVRRAKGPDVLEPRLIHAGNELVGPIGIPVASVEEFNAMTDAQLLGPEPAGGAAEQVKE